MDGNQHSGKSIQVSGMGNAIRKNPRPLAGSGVLKFTGEPSGKLRLPSERSRQPEERPWRDSINDSGKTGAVILVPDKTGEFTKQIYKNSNKYAEILKKKLEENNVKVNGIFERKDITGFNWSTVPVIIFEMGFMSNYNEDKMLSDKTYQMKLMECVSNSIDEYKNISY